MANESLDGLLAALEAAAHGLATVSRKRMFGCEGMFAGGNVFGLVWKAGRIGVRLPNEIAYAEAMKMPGSSPWVAGTMTMSHWVLLPEAMHADGTRLGAWVRRAHALAQAPAKRGAPLRSEAPKRPNAAPTPASPVAPKKAAAARKKAAVKAPKVTKSPATSKKRPAAKAKKK